MSCLSAISDWIGRYHDQLLVVLTLAAVIMAGWYAVLTRRLAQTADTSARAAADQARSTRLIFEAAHRPYLDVGIVDHSRYWNPELFDFRFDAKNHGAVPAVVVSWHVVARIPDGTVLERHPEQNDSIWTLFPDQETSFVFEKREGQPIGSTVADVEVTCTVRYRGLHETVYTTRTSAISWGTGVTHWRTTEINVE